MSDSIGIKEIIDHGDPGISLLRRNYIFLIMLADELNIDPAETTLTMELGETKLDVNLKELIEQTDDYLCKQTWGTTDEV